MNSAATLTQRSFLEARYIFRKNHPVLRRARPDMSFYLKPIGVVEGAAEDNPSVRKTLQLRRDGSAAAPAELETNLQITLVRGVFIGGKIVASDLGIFFSEEHSDPAYAASASLAKRAVTNRHAHRLAFYTVSMCPAKAATLMDVGHNMASFSSCTFHATQLL